MLKGDWDLARPDPIHRLAGKTLGLVGLGQIGSAVAKKLAGWGVDILAADPFISDEHASSLGVRRVDLTALCRQSDYISLHVPLLPETRHLISLVQLQMLKPGCILINTSRGPVLDCGALLQALDNGRLLRAGLDVFEEEPLPADSPLRRHPAILLTDHTAWYSEESQIQLQYSAARAVVTGCQGGLPASMSNPQVLFRLGRFEEWEPAACMQWQLARMKRLQADRPPSNLGLQSR